MANHAENMRKSSTSKFCVDILDDTVVLEEKLGLLTELEAEAVALRDRDHAFVQQAFAFIDAATNSVAPTRPMQQVDADGSPSVTSAINPLLNTKHETLRFELERYAGLEAFISVDLAISSLVSTDALNDLKRANPFLTSAAVDEIGTKNRSVHCAESNPHCEGHPTSVCREIPLFG